MGFRLRRSYRVLIQYRIHARITDVNKPAMIDHRKITFLLRLRFLPPIPGRR